MTTSAFRCGPALAMVMLATASLLTGCLLAGCSPDTETVTTSPASVSSVNTGTTRTSGPSSSSLPSPTEHPAISLPDGPLVENWPLGLDSVVVYQNRSLAIVDEQGVRFGVEVLPPLTGTTTWPPAPGTPRFSCVVSTNGKYLAYLHDGKDLVVRAMSDGSLVGAAQSEVGYQVNSVSNDGKYVLLSDRTDFHQQTPGNVTLVCLNPGEAPSRVDVMALLRSRGLEADFVTAIRWSAPDNSFVLQDIYSTESDASETRWFLYQPENGTLTQLDEPWQTDLPLEPGDSIMAEAVSPDGKAVVLMTYPPGAAPNNQLELFKREGQGWVAASRPWPVLDGGHLFGLSADNRTAWVFSQGNDLTTVDMETGEQHGWLGAGDVKVPLQILIPVLSD